MYVTGDFPGKGFFGVERIQSIPRVGRLLFGVVRLTGDLHVKIEK